MGTSYACLVSGGEMGVEHVSELCCAVSDLTFDSMHVLGPCVLTQGQEGGKDLRAAKAVDISQATTACFLSDSSVPE